MGSFPLQKFNPNLNFDTLPGDFFKSLVKLGYCANAISERICEYLSDSVFGMDSKNIDKVKCKMILRNFMHAGALTHSFPLARTHTQSRSQPYHFLDPHFFLYSFSPEDLFT